MKRFTCPICHRSILEAEWITEIACSNSGRHPLTLMVEEVTEPANG